MHTLAAAYNIGEIIYHRNFNYRGVIVDVDPNFQGTDEWYEKNAVSHPAKDIPWYHVLVGDEDLMTYVAQSNLELSLLPEPLEHPMLESLFSGYDEGKYNLRMRLN
jgi:heat shock protein HspQ